eukprot:gnl/Dysnectes_brevis/464_a516_3378.p1 GENE.gnl/Dysnectes_brevis/464_a516_3378~~gnl/Dysnectes_brevis/464_a516_3378.p1  ORF type:complete len:373 (+),score=140.18 gnl/Dysnectes_brevis/464_a516_3378:40-1158(+)
MAALEHLEDERRYVTLGEKYPKNSFTPTDPDAYGLGVDALNIEIFKRDFKLVPRSISDDTLTFDLHGIDAPIANALRRIMLDEVPTMAIETVVMKMNTSIIQDEVLAHRLGQIPILADPSVFEFHKPDTQYTPYNCCVFVLDVSAPETVREGDYPWYKVYSSDLKWVPIGDQLERFSPEAGGTIRPVHDDILLAKLAPGQHIHAELYVEKGLGLVHAKWSPVGTAFYSMMPRVTVRNTVPADRVRLARLCPSGVFSLEQGGAAIDPDEVNLEDIEDLKLDVDSDRCTTCRECVLKMPDNVTVKLDKRHFRFTVESTGCMTAPEIVTTALEVMGRKAAGLMRGLSPEEPKEEEEEKQEDLEAEEDVQEHEEEE